MNGGARTAPTLEERLEAAQKARLLQENRQVILGFHFTKNHPLP